MVQNTLKKAVERSGLSGFEVSRRAGMASSDFYQVLHGKRHAFPKWRRQLSEVLGVPESELFPETEEVGAAV